jgi:CheY-like chemotaxis protein
MRSDAISEKDQGSILLVDDTPENRHKWKAALERARFRVAEASSRSEALSYLRDADSAIDLLLTGLIRDAEGAQLAVEALELRASLPFVLAADAANPVGIQDQFALLLNPVSDAELVSAARTLLSDK